MDLIWIFGKKTYPEVEAASFCQKIVSLQSSRWANENSQCPVENRTRCKLAAMPRYAYRRCSSTVSFETGHTEMCWIYQPDTMKCGKFINTTHWNVLNLSSGHRCAVCTYQSNRLQCSVMCWIYQPDTMKYAEFFNRTQLNVLNLLAGHN